MLAFGNVGFIGYPIVASIFGANAVFYACILNFPSTLLIFVFGTLFVSGGEGKVRFDWRTLYCPAMIASYLSILIVVTGWIPPKVLSTPFVLLGNITVPAAVGSSIAQVPIWRMFSNTAIYLMSALRLMLVPLLILYLSRLCRVEETIANINVVLAAMPVASYGTLFCIQYGKGEVIMAEGPNASTYPRGCLRGVCDTPLQANWVKCGYSLTIFINPFFVLIIATILGGCNNHPTSPTLLNKVENLMPAQPDSAYALLASIDTDTNSI